VGENDIADIPASIFNLNDPDTPIDSLVIIVVEPPTNGNHIVKANMGTDVILEAGDVITLGDLRDGKVRFVHSSPDVKDSKSTFYIMPFNSFRTPNLIGEKSGM
jgi:hypothetical protein